MHSYAHFFSLWTHQLSISFLFSISCGELRYLWLEEKNIIKANSKIFHAQIQTKANFIITKSELI
jgi:hypothetical protein